MTRPIERARRLLILAKRDITSFRALASHPEVDISATGFFAQQVVEKCLKAVAEYHGIVFRRTHDVGELVDLLLQHQVAQEEYDTEKHATLFLERPIAGISKARKPASNHWHR